MMGSRIKGYRRDNFAKALLLSLALHALVLSLQFGDSDNGLPWFGMPEESKIASIPMLNAILHSQQVVEKPLPEQVAQPVVRISEKPAAASPVSKPAPVSLPPEPVTANIAKPETHPQEPLEKPPVAAVVPEAKKIAAPAAAVAVLSTDKESTWSRPAGQALPDDETLNKQEGVEQQKEAHALEQKTVDDQARIEEEKVALEAAAREKELALERKRAEEQARLAAMKADQAAAAKAKEEAARVQQAEAEAVARKRDADKLATEKAAKVAAEKILAEQQKMAEEQARIEKEKAALAAATREKELALEKKRAEEQARLAAMKAEQAAAARAREEAARAQQAEAEALARKGEADRLAAEKAAKDAAARVLAEQQSRLSNAAAGKPDGSKESGNSSTAGPTTGPTAGSSAGKGSELARRAIDAIRGGQMGLPGIESAEPVRPRRGSILGRDPKDIQLAFYGEGWRLKVERIGSLNYPTLSKNLTYDPLVVTVSINSDGTLAGVRVVKSSGHKDLDEAVLRIVTMSAPFSPFPPDMKRIYDVVDITRTWVFLEYQPRITN